MYKPGDQNYRAFVGYYESYDIISASLFSLLAAAGLREDNTVCDFGCGSLRLGRLLINFLQKGNYHGIEPNKWLIDEGINNELFTEVINKKQPQFYYFDDFDFSRINFKYDFIISKSVFTHTSLESIEVALSTIKNVMHNNSIFFASFILGKKDYKGIEKWSYPDVVSYKYSTIKSIAKKTKLKLELLNWKDGQNWLYFYNQSIKREIINKVININKTNHLNLYLLKKLYYKLFQ